MEFSHRSIEAAAPKPYECLVGWVTHYVIGIIYAVVLVLLVTPQWLRDPTLLPAMLMGFATVVFPFFVMHGHGCIEDSQANTGTRAQSAESRGVRAWPVFGGTHPAVDAMQTMWAHS